MANTVPQAFKKKKCFVLTGFFTSQAEAQPRFSFMPLGPALAEPSLGSSVLLLKQLLPGSTAILTCVGCDRFPDTTSNLHTFAEKQVLCCDVAQYYVESGGGGAGGCPGKQTRPSNVGKL